MVKSKGQYTPMVAVFTLLFVSSGLLYSSIAGQHSFSSTFDYYSGDVAEIADTKARAERYRSNMNQELNFTWNAKSVELASDAGGLGWQDSSYPSMREIKNRLSEGMVLDSEIGLRSQSRIKECAPPRINSVEFPGQHTAEINFESREIQCDGFATDVKTVFGGEVEVENQDNNYLPVAEYATILSEKAYEITPETISDYDYEESGCPGSASSTRESSKDNARQGALSGLNLAERAYDETSGERPDYVEANQKETEFSGSYTDNLAINSDSCTYYVFFDVDGDGEDERFERQGTRYMYNYTYTVNRVTYKYELEDSDHVIFTPEEPESRIVFDFEYVRTLQ